MTNAAGTIAEEPGTNVPPEGIKVLLVDDSGFARRVGHRVLRAAGIHSIMEAANGKDALDILEQPGQAVDVIFCDLLMPDMDGLQFVRRVANLVTQPAFVFLSGANAALLHTAEDTGRARGLRVLGVIEKPLTPDAVHRVLARLGEKPARGERSSGATVTPEDLEVALAKEQFVLHFQPKVSMAEGSIMGFESLVRWLHPERGLIPPGAFIATAEKSGQIGALTDQVTMLALKQCAAWLSAGLRTKVSVNLSAHMLVDLDLPDRMARIVESFGIDARQLILEITESGLFQNAGDTLDILARLHMKGFALSIDDFGTGYSSMEQLNRIPFAEMKIDRAFVSGASENAKAKAILQSSAALGQSLRMCVVAEGAETQEDWDVVRAAGVDLVQGYLIAKPMAADEIPAWLAKSARKYDARAYTHTEELR